ncbi:hypothetical protein [Dactylosporangium sp. NPDC051484]|uniref:hypothetical protein n=1 Tax=Dactylosporangium sp. NPDC051484 TaxID=3154942 RepID=UPI00344CA151
MTEEQSLALSHADFVQVAGLLGEPVPDYLGAPVAAYTRLRREEAFAASRRALVERAVVLPGHPPRIPLSVVRLVQIVCRPALSSDVHRYREGFWQESIRYAVAADAAVEILSEEDGVRLTPFHSDDLLSRIAARAGIEELPRPGTGTNEALLPDLTSMTAVSAYARVPGGRAGGELAWAATNGYWLIPTTLTPLAGTPGTATDDIKAQLTPVSGIELAEALRTSFTFHN